jgi:hypothetical protein
MNTSKHSLATAHFVQGPLKVYFRLIEPLGRPTEDVTGINDLTKANVLVIKPPDKSRIRSSFNV